MLDMKVRDWWVPLAAGLGLGLSACGPGTPVTAVDGSSGSSTSPNPTSSSTVPVTGVDTTAGIPTSDGSGSTAGVDTTAGPTSASTTSPMTTDTMGSESSGTTGPEPGTSEGSSSSGGMEFMCPPGGGAACTEPGDCASNACFTVGPIGGVCSECDEDADCAFGCHPGNPITGDCALCCDGSPGCGCETALACQAGLYCTTILLIPGIIDQSTCSECESDLDCAGGDLCSPLYDLNSFDGVHECVPPGSKANGEGCDLDGSGDQQCASGNCANTQLMGIPFIGVCSECNEDSDCLMGSCVLPEVEIAGTMLNIVQGFCS